MLEGIHICLEASSVAIFLWIFPNSRQPNLLLVQSHQVKTIMEKRLIQRHNKIARVRVESKSCDQSRRKNDVFALLATLSTCSALLTLLSPVKFSSAVSELRIWLLSPLWMSSNQVLSDEAWQSWLYINKNRNRPRFNCNCDYVLFTKLPRPGDSEGTFRSSNQAATCPLSTTHGGGFTLSL